MRSLSASEIPSAENARVSGQGAGQDFKERRTEERKCLRKRKTKR